MNIVKEDPDADEIVLLPGLRFFWLLAHHNSHTFDLMELPLRLLRDYRNVHNDLKLRHQFDIFGNEAIGAIGTDILSLGKDFLVR